MTLTTSEQADPLELDELAALTGYENGTVTNGALTTAAPVSVESEDEDDSSNPEQVETGLLDPEDFHVDDATQHRLWNSPWSKLIFVGLFLGVGALTVGLVMFGFQSKWSSSQDPTTAPKVQPPPPKTEEQFAPLSETGDLKTKEALSRQATALDQNTDSVTAAPGTTSAGTPATAARPAILTTAPRAATTPIQYSAPASASSRYSASSSTPSYSPPASVSSQYSAPAPVQYSAPAASLNSAPSADPVEQWQSAVALGSYGQVSYSSSAPVATPALASTDNSTGNSAYSTVLADKTAPPPADYQQSLYEADASAILSGAPSHVTTIMAGTVAAATLSTPVVWAQDLDNSQQPQRFGIQITQPLLAADGSEALPVGTQLVAQVDTISDSGLVELSIQSVIEPSANGNRLVSVPPGALMIQGDRGRPLMAENYHNNGGRINQLNTQVGIIGALGKLGELLNRPSNTSTVSSPYLSSTSTSNNSTNILGGLLEGGFGSLQEQMTQQDQQEIKDILDRPNVWYVPEGASIQIFANSSFVVAP